MRSLSKKEKLRRETEEANQQEKRVNAKRPSLGHRSDFSVGLKRNMRPFIYLFIFLSYSCRKITWTTRRHSCELNKSPRQGPLMCVSDLLSLFCRWHELLRPATGSWSSVNHVGSRRSEIAGKWIFGRPVEAYGWIHFISKSIVFVAFNY